MTGDAGKAIISLRAAVLGNTRVRVRTGVLDGVPFLGSWYGDAGVGNYYEARTYRAVHNETCYEIGPETKIENFDRDVVLEDLMEVLNTFHFVP